LEAHLATAAAKASEVAAQAAQASAVTSRDAQTAPADQKYMVGTVDQPPNAAGGWAFRQVEPKLHIETMQRSLPLLRLIGRAPPGPSRHVAFFRSSYSYVLDAGFIRSTLGGLLGSSTHPPWALGNAGSVIHEVTNFPVWKDLPKFEAFLRFKFGFYRKSDSIVLSLADFVNSNSIKAYSSKHYDHVIAGVRGLRLMMIVGPGYHVTSKVLDPVITVLTDSSDGHNLRMDYGGKVIDFAVMQALSQISDVLSADSSEVTSKAHIFRDDWQNTHMQVVGLIDREFQNVLNSEHLNKLNNSIDRLIESHREIAESLSSLEPEKKKLKADTGTTESGKESASSAAKDPGLCHADTLHLLGIPSNKGKVPTSCPRGSSCRFSHGSVLFPGLPMTWVKQYVKDHAAEPQKAKYLHVLNTMSRATF
jgi:hypothetical protein